jgi:transcriptional regulator with XRE-family HTH domain
MRRSKNPQPALGAAIRELRAEREMTQEAVAQSAGVTVAHLSGIERGRGNPSWGAVVAITEALGVSMATLAKRWEAAKERK